MKICPKCGTENEDRATLCSLCGEPISQTAGDAEETDADYVPVRRADRKKTSASFADKLFSFVKRFWKILLPALAVLIIAIAVISVVSSIKPDVGLLALTPTHVEFTLSGQTAEGAVPLMGLMDERGSVVLSAEYQRILGEIDTKLFAVIGSNSKIGAVNEKGRKIIDFEYIDADVSHGISEGLWAVSKGGKWGYVDKKGREKIGFTYEKASGFSEGLAAVMDGSKWGYINKKGELVIDCQFENAGVFSQGLARICVDGKYGFIDKSGKTVIEPQFNLAFEMFNDGLCLVQVGTRYGFIDKKGEYAINPQFDDAMPFSEGLAAVRLEDKVGYIDKNGKYVIKPVFDGYPTFESMFVGGRAVVSKGSTSVLIDKTGGEIVPEDVGCLIITKQNGFCTVKVGEKFGIVDSSTGKFTLEPTYYNCVCTLRDVSVFTLFDGRTCVFVSKDGVIAGEVASQVQNAFSYITDKSDYVRAIYEWEWYKIVYHW